MSKVMVGYEIRDLQCGGWGLFHNDTLVVTATHDAEQDIILEDLRDGTGWPFEGICTLAKDGETRLPLEIIEEAVHRRLLEYLFDGK